MFLLVSLAAAGKSTGQCPDQTAQASPKGQRKAWTANVWIVLGSHECADVFTTVDSPAGGVRVNVIHTFSLLYEEARLDDHHFREQLPDTWRNEKDNIYRSLPFFRPLAEHGKSKGAASLLAVSRFATGTSWHQTERGDCV